MEISKTDDTLFGNNSMTRNLTEDFLTFMEEAQGYMTFKASIYINYYYFLILAPIGLMGNTLSFLVMIKPNNRKMSTCIYMAAISITDNLMMLVALHNWLMGAEDILKYHPIHCKIDAWLTIFARLHSRYQVLAMTIDKFVAIKWPHRAATYSTPRKAKSILIGVFICTLIYNVPHLFMSGVVRGKCRAFVFGGKISMVFTWINFIVDGIIALSMLTYLNYVIVQTVRNSEHMFGTTAKLKNVSNKETGMETREIKIKSAEKQLTFMLLLVTMLYLVLQVPTYIRYLIYIFVTLDTPSKYASSILFLMVTYALSMTSSGINFFLYCTSGQKFRNDLKEMLCYNAKRRSCVMKNPNNQTFTPSVSQNTLHRNMNSDDKGAI